MSVKADVLKADVLKGNSTQKKKSLNAEYFKKLNNESLSKIGLSDRDMSFQSFDQIPNLPSVVGNSARICDVTADQYSIGVVHEFYMKNFHFSGLLVEHLP